MLTHTAPAQVYVYGGQRSSSSVTGVLDGRTISVLDVSTWAALDLDTHASNSSSVILSRTGHSMVAWGRGLLVFGGGTSPTSGDTLVLLNDIAFLNLATLEWTQLAPRHTGEAACVTMCFLGAIRSTQARWRHAGMHRTETKRQGRSCRVLKGPNHTTPPPLNRVLSVTR